MIVAVENWQSSCEPAPLRPGDVHLWRARLVPTDEMRPVLSHDEWIAAGRFHFEKDRKRYLATRGLQRLILAKYAGCEPHELRFVTGRHGKPELVSPTTALRFNLSHSNDLLLLAVTYGREIGVDLEFMRPDVPFEALADHYFHPDDAWDLRLLPESERAWKFYDIWTSTEAQLKASGDGIANGLQVAEPHRWSLHKLTPAAGYAAALAVGGGEFQLACWSWELASGAAVPAVGLRAPNGTKVVPCTTNSRDGCPNSP
jgi:4'-phosphopantetheinyl transferase